MLTDKPDAILWASVTPRTDAEACEAITGLGTCVGVNFARELERENRWLRARLSELARSRYLDGADRPEIESFR